MPKARKSVHSHAVAVLRSLEDKTKFQTIGEIARKYGVSLRALRFYEERGLLKPDRIGDVRLYSVEQETRLQIILKGKHLGFKLAEIVALIMKENIINFTLDEFVICSQISYLEERRTEIDLAIVNLRERLKYRP